MTLQSLTKIDRCGLNTTSNYRVGIITASQFYKAEVDIDKVLFVHYAGFSTNICLYDRPHGIYFTRLFDDYFTRVLMRDATSTWEFSNRKASFTENFINYLEWHHLPSFVSTDFF